MLVLKDLKIPLKEKNKLWPASNMTSQSSFVTFNGITTFVLVLKNWKFERIAILALFFEKSDQSDQNLVSK